MASDYPDECFFISPVGEEGSPERERADGVLRTIVEPAAASVGLTAIRADHMADPGQITTQIIDHLIGAAATVADLTDGNPNVFYELGVRHSFRKPVALLAERETTLPFDAYQMRTIFFDPSSLKSVADARDLLADHLRRALEGAVDSPVATTLDIQSLRTGSGEEQGLAEVLLRMDEFGHRLSQLGKGMDEISRQGRIARIDDHTVTVGDLSPEPVTGAGWLPSEPDRQIVRLLAEGNSIHEMAQSLDVGDASIMFKIQKLRRRIGVKTSHELVEYAKTHGWIPTDT